MNKRNNWFLDYHDKIRMLNSRVEFFNLNDFKDATVLDMGCNEGQMCSFSKKNGAIKVMGIDYDQTIIQKCILKNKDPTISFVSDDADNFFMYTILDDFDVILLLSVIDTHELTNRFGILSRLCNKTKKVMYFEGHNNQFYSKYMKMLQDYTDFTSIEYLGNTIDNNNTPGNGRPFFRCSRDTYNIDTAVQKIYNILENTTVKIAVVGRGGCGKTTLRKKLQLKYENKTNYNDSIAIIDTGSVSILDDVSSEVYKKLHLNDKIVFFDYKALVYEDKFDVVFHIFRDKKDERYILSRLPEKLNSNAKMVFHINNNISV